MCSECGVDETGICHRPRIGRYDDVCDAKDKKVARILPIVEKAEETQDDLWKEAVRIFNTKEHTQDGRDLLMTLFTITRKL